MPKLPSQCECVRLSFVQWGSNTGWSFAVFLTECLLDKLEWWLGHLFVDWIIELYPVKIEPLQSWSSFRIVLSFWVMLRIFVSLSLKFFSHASFSVDEGSWESSKGNRWGQREEEDDQPDPGDCDQGHPGACSWSLSRLPPQTNTWQVSATGEKSGVLHPQIKYMRVKWVWILFKFEPNVCLFSVTLTSNAYPFYVHNGERLVSHFLVIKHGLNMMNLCLRYK